MLPTGAHCAASPRLKAHQTIEEAATAFLTIDIATVQAGKTEETVQARRGRCEAVVEPAGPSRHDGWAAKMKFQVLIRNSGKLHAPGIGTETGSIR